MTPSQESSAERLLAHAGWMRALALGLVRDPHEADDVVQDAALAALLHAPPAEAALRPWLASVVRNFAWRRRRAATRRSEHEDRARRPDSGEDVDVLERIDLQRKLLEAVRELPEPQRSTLVKRYFEGQTSADIARSQDVPAATVRARLKRGLEQLRERLDREAGSRQAWMALVLPLVPRELVPTAVGAGGGAVTASLVTQGALTMTLAKIALVTSAVLISGLAWWNLTPQGTGGPPSGLAPSEVRAEPALLQAAAPEPTAEAQPVERSAAAVAEPAVGQPVPQAALPGAKYSGRFEVRVVDVNGSPWPEAQLSVFHPRAEGGAPLATGITGPDGRAEVEVELPRYTRDAVGGAAGSFALVARHAGCATRRIELVVREGELTHVGDIALLDSGIVRGTVVDEHGLAIAGARVGTLSAEALEALDDTERERLPRVGSDLIEMLVSHETRADGSFELDDVAPGSVVLWTHAPQRLFALGEVLQVQAHQAIEDVRLVLPALTTGDRIAGQVVGPDGKGRPASLARDMRSSMGRTINHFDTDPDGRFDFPAPHLDSVYSLVAHDGYREFAPGQAKDVRPGDVNVVIVLGRSQQLRLSVRDEQGQPIEDAILRIDGDSLIYEVTATDLGPGEFGLEIPAERFRIVAMADGYRSARSARIDYEAPPAEVELVLERAPRVRGQVTANGRPLAGAVVLAHTYDENGSMTVNALRCTISPFQTARATTDSEGRFDLAVDSDSRIVLRAAAPGWADAECEPFELAALGDDEEFELELGPGGVIEGRVLVPAGESAGGRIVGVHRGDGRPRSMRTTEDGSFRFEGLMPGDWLVLELEAEVPPHGGSYASYSGSAPMPWNCRVEAGQTAHLDLEVQ